MNLVSSIRVRYEELRVLDFASIGAAYVAVGAAFSNPVRILKVTNFTDANLIISFNGIDDHDVVAANGFYLYDFGSNKSTAGGLMEQPAGERLYVREETLSPSSGNVYVTIVYASQV